MTIFATDNVASNIVARMCCSYCLGGILLWVLHSVRMKRGDKENVPDTGSRGFQDRIPKLKLEN